MWDIFLDHLFPWRLSFPPKEEEFEIPNALCLAKHMPSKKTRGKTNQLILHHRSFLFWKFIASSTWYPQIKVEVLVVEGRERGPAIVEAARKQMASLLVLGQKQKRSLAWSCIAVLWSNRGSDGIKPSGGDGQVDYCIKNASCMTLAVRRKSKRGGYLITTKHHKDFWLLAWTE